MEQERSVFIRSGDPQLVAVWVSLSAGCQMAALAQKYEIGQLWLIFWKISSPTNNMNNFYTKLNLSDSMSDFLNNLHVFYIVFIDFNFFLCCTIWELTVVKFVHEMSLTVFYEEFLVLIRKFLLVLHSSNFTICETDNVVASLNLFIFLI